MVDAPIAVRKGFSHRPACKLGTKLLGHTPYSVLLLTKVPIPVESAGFPTGGYVSICIAIIVWEDS